MDSWTLTCISVMREAQACTPRKAVPQVIFATLFEAGLIDKEGEWVQKGVMEGSD